MQAAKDTATCIYNNKKRRKKKSFLPYNENRKARTTTLETDLKALNKQMTLPLQQAYPSKTQGGSENLYYAPPQ